MKNDFYILRILPDKQKILKGFSNTDNHGHFLLFPLEFSQYFQIGSLLESTTGYIRINEVGFFSIGKTKMLRLYYDKLSS